MKKSISILTFSTVRIPFSPSSSSSSSSSTSRISPLMAFVLSLLILTLRPNAVLAVDVDPLAPTTPCIPSRTVDPSIQTDVALGCQVLVDVTEAVCTDYLAQQLPLAISQFCGNQSEAYTYCISLPSSSSILDCLAFDPSGGISTTDGEVFPPCTEEALDTYNLCGNSTGSGYFETGDLVSLTQCLFLELDLCTPEDGEGHYNTVFEGDLTDCPVPVYTPACGVDGTAAVTAAATTTTTPASTAAASSSAAVTAAASSSAAPSSQTTEPAAATSITATTSTISAPSAPPTASSSTPPPGSSPYFYLALNGTLTSFVSPSGSITPDRSSAQLFYLLNGQLFTHDGLLVQAADDGGSSPPPQPVPYILFVGSDGALPFSTTFELVTAGIGPSAVVSATQQDRRKRQIVGQTSLFWVNDAFAAPGTTAGFCVFEEQVFAVLVSEELDVDFSAGCVSVTLDAIYVETPVSAPSSSTVTTTVINSPASTMVTTVGLSPKSCPIGQTLMAYTTIYF